MKNYIVTVDERIEQDYVVEAKNREQAEEQVRAMFERGEFAMDRCDVLERSFIVCEKEGDE